MRIAGTLYRVMAWLLIGGSLFLLPGMSDAMEIRHFDRVSVADQRRYHGMHTIGSVKYLWTHNWRADGDAVLALFEEKPGGSLPDGTIEFIITLNSLRQARAR